MKQAVLNEKMLQRIEEINQATYKYLQTLLEMDDEQMKETGLRKDAILQEILGYAMSALSRKALFICNPYICEELKVPYLCTPAECKCKKCTRQDEFMHKERMCAYIQDILEGAGFSIMSIEEGIAFKEEGTDDTFMIRIMVQEGSKDAEN